ncbi:MAG: segregation/condensation protein A [Saprospiraceae bacterium]|nr:segregation/condensation protein A [Saprospiraceae bacterium]MBP9195571.1 segregation/condensation protein A [Saprospiraceae bacterium]
MQTYTIKTERFEGPFDLLLFFIERDELDINDIPIAQITDDFLSYIKELETLNIDVASEFILVAATLMRIKAKMLIPRKELDELGNEIDPREELAQRLLEYKRFKEVVDDFVSLEDIRLSRHHRGDAATELKLIAGKALVDLELESLSLYKLLLTFQKIMERFEQQQNKPVHTIVKYGYTIETQQHYILDSIRTKERVDFAGLFESAENRIHALVTFLALLELLNLQQVQILQGEGINNFWVYPGAADGNNPEPAED